MFVLVVKNNLGQMFVYGPFNSRKDAISWRNEHASWIDDDKIGIVEIINPV